MTAGLQLVTCNIGDHPTEPHYHRLDDPKVQIGTTTHEHQWQAGPVTRWDTTDWTSREDDQHHEYRMATTVLLVCPCGEIQERALS